MPLRQSLPAVSLLLVVLLASCRSTNTTEDWVERRDEVIDLLNGLTDDLSARGPEAWPDYFLDDASFFMASEGAMLFPDLASAKAGCAELDARVQSIDLDFDEVRIQWIDPTHAIMSAEYEETLVDTSGTTKEMEGFVTALIAATSAGWRFQHLHWSSPLEADSDGDADAGSDADDTDG
ncbi:MAG: nuclear transport factor 2 family protein [Planctomycetota bacterium]